MFYGGEQHQITDTTLTKFELTIENTILKEMFIQQANLTIRDSLVTLRKNHLHGKEWKDVWRYFFLDIYSRKKVRWKDKAFRDLKQKKLKTPKELLRLYTDYIEIYSEDEIEIKLKKPKSDIIAWAEADSAYLYQYPFFLDKTPKTKSTALEDDLTLTFLSYLKNEWDVEARRKGKKVTEIPYDNQVMYSNFVHKAPMNPDGMIERNGKMIPYKDVGRKESPVRIMVESNPDSLDMANSLGLTTDIYDLDQIDRDIMTSLLEYREANFAIDKTIEVRLGDLVRDVFSSDNKRNYESVRNRLIKLQRIRFTHVVPEALDGVLTGEVGYREHMGFIEYIKEIKNAQGETYMTIEVNQGLHKRFINNQTLKIYRDQIDLLDSTYRSMLYYMQKERIKAYHMGQSKSELTMTNFQSNIQFRYSSKKKIREEISESLDEIIKKKLIVRSYTHGRELFMVEFEPISDQEVKDIIGEKKDPINFQHLLSTSDESL